ncbi:MAG: DUF805 domain-containing protein [Rhodobacteraceae bacterium]|nr:DUF805 domain-containing protein [Paracoccaceae bacterium]
MDFQTAIRTCLGKYATFSGRARRPEFWWFFLFCILVQLVCQMIDAAVFGAGPDSGEPVSLLASVALLLPSLGVGARRLHDTGRTGWWLLIGLIPIVGILILLWWFTRPSVDTPEAERFGPA